MAREMRNSERKKKKFLEKNAPLVSLAMDEGNLSRNEICKATGLNMWELGQLFKDDRELYAKYTLRRRTLVDSAADNIQEIVLDKDHPKNYDASKYVLNNYKSDLDNILDTKDEDIQVSGKGMRSSKVTLKFKK